MAFYQYLINNDKSCFYTEVSRRNDESTTSHKSTAKVSLAALNGLINGILPQNLISFRPFNKAKKDVSGQGSLDRNNVKHPTVKPTNMLEYLIKLCTNEGDVVLDPFMGSGTTGLACQNTNRRFIGIELDADYFEIARDRIETARSKAMLDTPIQLNTPAPLPTKPKIQQTLF